MFSPHRLAYVHHNSRFCNDLQHGSTEEGNDRLTTRQLCLARYTGQQPYPRIDHALGDGPKGWVGSLFRSTVGQGTTQGRFER